MEVSEAILGALGGHLGAKLEVLVAIFGILELMLDEVGLGNRKSGLRIGICKGFMAAVLPLCWHMLAYAGICWHVLEGSAVWFPLLC